MFKAIRQYSADEIRPRLRWILFTTDFVGSIVIASGLTFFSGTMAGTGPKISDLTTGLIAYSAIVLGFCVAGMTVALTIPDRKFAETLARDVFGTAA